MLGKKYSLGSIVEETGEARIKLANFDELKAQSDDVASFLNTFSPDSGFVYLHVIAMGAGEYYGCNINGDYFPERDLIARHNTFVTNAKVFKEHDNKPYSPDYGHVAFSWYNPKMHRVELILAVDKIKGKEFIDRQARGEQLEVSMGCFPAGTRVSLGDYTFKNIEDIIPGDQVVTHTGETHSVVTKMMHKFSGKLYNFTIGGQTRTLTCTDNHPILVRRYMDIPTQGEGECPVCGKHIKQVYTHLCRSTNSDHKDYVAKLHLSKYEYTEDWVRADQIKIGDYVVTPIPVSDTNSYDNEALALICGYFLAEGSYIKYKGTYVALQFNFADNETHLHTRVLQALAKLSNVKPTYQIREAKHLGCISIYDKDLASRVYELCGEYSKYKKIGTEIFTWSKDDQLTLLGAYIDGDGTWNTINKKASCVTISQVLADGVIKLAASCGLSPSLAEYQGKHNRTYLVTFSGSDTAVLTKVAYKVPDYQYEWKLAKLPVVFNDNGMIVRRVQDISVNEVTDFTVYNLSVEEDESFVTENIAVHNCKVAFDVCSICGNKAKKASDYCTHIRHDKKKIYPDGKQPYMINYNPTFFDISIVRRRADRIAYVLSKVASADNSVSNYMAEEFENLGDSMIPFAPHPEEAVFDWDDAVEKSATIDEPKSMTLQEKIAMIKRINASAVKIMDEGVQKLIPALEKEEPDLPVELLDSIARKYSIPDILRSFALKGTPMKPREFARIVIVQTGIPKEKFSEVLQGILSATPVKRLPDARYQGEIGSMLDPFLMDRSSFLPAIIHRILKLKSQPEKTAAAITLDPIGSYLDLDPRLAFGHVRRPLAYQAIGPEIPDGSIPVQRDPYATTPVVMNAAMLEQERRRPKLKDPILSPGKTALALGAIYAAYRNVDAVKALANDPKAMAILAAAAALIHSKSRMASPAAMQQKVASVMGAVGKIAIPFVGAHFLAAHYRNQYNNGINLNPVERYVAENPDVLSVAGPIALHYGLKKHANIQDVIIPDVTDVLGVEKIAELSDTAADAARNIFSGIILRGKNRSILSSVIDQAVDTHVMNTLLGSES